MQLFNDALLTRDLLLHLLQLHEQLALCRGRGRNPSPGIGAVRTITRRRIAACAAIACVVINNRNLSPGHERQGESQDGYSTTARSHIELLTQFDATVLSPGLLVVTGSNWTLFAVGNQFQLGRRNALQYQVALNGFRTTLAQSHVVFASTTLVGVTFQHDASAVAFQVLGMNVQSAHGFWLQVRAVVFEVEGGDCAQSSFFAQAAVNSASVGTVASVRIDLALTCVVTAFRGATYSYGHGQSQRSKLTKLQHFHRETPNEPQCVK
ncbi:protein of unknown function [Pseudomonas sp. JV241A]|nr:protein of unknown function [Pseudomonas sp. JV241A]